MALRRVLFLCTGNYYRSRLAEELFNHHAQRSGLQWCALSRGLALERGIANVGPISSFTLDALVERQIRPQNVDNYPLACTTADLANSDLIIAVKEAEHRALLASKFQGWEDKVTYWHVDDIEDAAPVHAIATLEQNILELVHILGRV